MTSLTLNVTILPQFSIFHHIQHEVFLPIRDAHLRSFHPELSSLGVKAMECVGKDQGSMKGLMVSLTLNVNILPLFSIFHWHHMQHDIFLLIRNVHLCSSDL